MSLLSVAIHGSLDELRAVASNRRYDFGCMATAIKTDEGDYILQALLTEDQYKELTDTEIRADIRADTIGDDQKAEVTVGKGDRFNGGQIPPQGLGSRPENQSHDLGGIMNPDEIDSAIKGLATEYGIPTFGVPNKTAEGSGGGGGLVGGVNPEDYHVYFTAGIHARERGGPDGLIYFISDLLYAQKHGTGLHYGGCSYSNADVLRALRTGIVFFPLVNPDGVRWDQKTDSLWRKNRNPYSAIPGDDKSIGVDINRNFDILWDFDRQFAPGVNPASTDPSDETFHGKAPFSEPESKNVAFVFDKFPRIRWFLDIHSHAGKVLYSWGDDNNQSNDAGQNFRNIHFDGQRGIMDIDDYREYISEQDSWNVRAAADRVAKAVLAVEGRIFQTQQSSALYPVSGVSADYAFSRFQVDGSKDKVYGLAMEFGPQLMDFYPTLDEFQRNVLDIGAGLMEFCLAATDIGLV